MKSQTTKRAALIAALSILAAIIGIALSMQHENGDVFVEIKPIPTPKATNVLSSTSLPSPAAALPSPTPEATLQPTYPSAVTPAPVQDGIAYTYAVSDIAIYESTSDWRLPTLDGSTLVLVLVTCYPFR